MNETYGDTLRLEQLGAKVFDLAVTVHLYNERPRLNSAEEIVASRALNEIEMITFVDGASTEQE
jgi:dsRNA-specific ribonuclease